MNHPSFDFYFYIENDCRKNVTKPKNLKCFAGIGTYVHNTDVDVFNVTKIVPDCYIDVHKGDSINTCDIKGVYYPVGSIYMSIEDVDPQTLFGYGTWEKIEDAFLFGSGTKSLNFTGGEEYHTLTIDEIPSHTHRVKGNDGGHTNTQKLAPYLRADDAEFFNQNVNDVLVEQDPNSIEKTGGGQSHNNMPPYLVVNIWKRIS